uniref:Sphingosine-1-phosphate phosphatase 1 n=1 Tax=Chrysemys picta bellii TaxID=8478 RepID=A0A8C3IE08_CHRPI
MALLQRLARLAAYLQDPQKVADFQRLCGVEGPPGLAASPAAAGGEKRQPRRNSLTGEAACQEIAIRNPFLYYLFNLGTELGNELFYILFFPFCIWNLDAWMGRRLIIVWVWVMYLGQCTKDVIRWPRPASPPVVKLEVFYNSEYSMPSTHAMSGTAIPLALVLLSYGRWQYPLMYGLILVICWCSLVCFSRIYMGMHSILVRETPHIKSVTLHNDDTIYLLSYPSVIFRYLNYTKVSCAFTSRGDTAQILGCGAGVACGSHFNYMLGLMQDPSPDTWPLIPPSITVTLFGKAILRLLIGVVLLLLTRIMMKKITIPLACKMFSIPCDDIRQARQRMEVELPYRYITYGMVGFSLMFLVPCLFLFIGLS